MLMVLDITLLLRPLFSVPVCDDDDDDDYTERWGLDRRVTDYHPRLVSSSNQRPVYQLLAYNVLFHWHLYIIVVSQAVNG